MGVNFSSHTGCTIGRVDLDTMYTKIMTVTEFIA